MPDDLTLEYTTGVVGFTCHPHGLVTTSAEPVRWVCFVNTDFIISKNRCLPRVYRANGRSATFRSIDTPSQNAQLNCSPKWGLNFKP
ncbi:hypothetical protein BS17DRAFT_818670 [Gyrodon lividus]|nr:hypothetical protein BS17DRAFT_818670 [Gyrodon lividus]